MCVYCVSSAAGNALNHRTPWQACAMRTTCIAHLRFVNLHQCAKARAIPSSSAHPPHMFTGICCFLLCPCMLMRCKAGPACLISGADFIASFMSASWDAFVASKNSQVMQKLNYNDFLSGIEVSASFVRDSSGSEAGQYSDRHQDVATEDSGLWAVTCL